MVKLIRKSIEAFMRFFFKHLYTTIAWAYDFVAWTTSMGQWRSWQQAALINYKAGRLLEIGHGPGHLLLDLQEARHEVFGVDASPQMTRIARDRFRKEAKANISVRAQAQSLPFPSSSFTGILATFPSEYIFDPDTLKSIHRSLNNEGKFVVVGLASITGRALYDRFAAWLYRITGQSDHPEQAYQPWLEELARVGFRARVELVDQPRARVLRLVATKETAS